MCGIGFSTGLLLPPKRVSEGVKLPCFYRALSVLLGQTTHTVWFLWESVETVSANQ